jgi:hypothetical protein
MHQYFAGIKSFDCGEDEPMEVKSTNADGR